MLLDHLLLCVAAFVAGAINSIAGGGSQVPLYVMNLESQFLIGQTTQEIADGTLGTVSPIGGNWPGNHSASFTIQARNAVLGAGRTIPSNQLVYLWRERSNWFCLELAHALDFLQSQIDDLRTDVDAHETRIAALEGPA